MKATTGRPDDEFENVAKENPRLGVALEKATPLPSAPVMDKRVKNDVGIYRLADGGVKVFA